jgi:putative oxidoreductase
MNIKRLFAVPRYAAFADTALLILRVVAGAAFMMHGWGKIQHPFNWMGPKAFAPGPFQALAALAEFGGGAAWILGMLTPLASLGILSTMCVAVFTVAVKSHAPFVSNTGGASWELAAVYLAVSLVFLAFGPGRFSLDRTIFGPR